MTMISLESIWPFVLLALLGGLHCAGMCGGFSVLACRSAATRRALFVRQSLFLLGKASTYALLGLSAAIGWSWIAAQLDRAGAAGEGGLALADLRRAMAWLAGATMVAFGLGTLGWRVGRAARLPRWLEAGVAALRSTFGSIARLPGYAGPLGLGLMTGLLPCGLSWSAVALGAASPPAVAALGCFLFGLGTAPALVLVSLGWRGLARLPQQRQLSRLAAVSLVAFGLYTVLRGGLPGASRGLAEAALPACCEQP